MEFYNWYSLIFSYTQTSSPKQLPEHGHIQLPHSVYFSPFQTFLFGNYPYKTLPLTTLIAEMYSSFSFVRIEVHL
jgi:hypothetical protein